MGFGWVSCQIWLQSLCLSSCSELGRSISPLASTPLFQQTILLLQALLLPETEPAGYPGEDTGLSHWSLDFFTLTMSPRPLAPFLTLICHLVFPQAGFAMAWRLFIIDHQSLTIGRGPTTLRAGSPGWGSMFLAWQPLPSAHGLALALRSTWTICSSAFSSSWGPSWRSDNGAYSALVPGGGLRNPQQTYAFPQVLLNLSCNMLCSLRSESSLAHGGEALVDPLPQVQDELTVRGTSQLLKGSILPSL